MTRSFALIAYLEEQLRVSSRVAFVLLTALSVGACGNDSPTQPSGPGGGTGGGNTNRAPVITSMNVTPTFLISGLTNLQGTASATDADNDTLAYSWNLIGTTLSGPIISGSIIGPGGDVTIRLTVSDGKGGSATDTRIVTVGSMAGNWAVTILDPCGPVGFPLTLTQISGIVTGSGVATVPWCAASAGDTFRIDPAEPGSIDADGNVNLRIKVGTFLDFYLRGKMQNSGRSIVGTAHGSGLNGQAVLMVKQ